MFWAEERSQEEEEMNAPTGHIVSRLRSLAKADHDDLSVAEEAAEYIEALERYGKELEA